MRACIDCGRPSDGTRCPEHRRAYNPRGSSTDQGYGAAWRKVRSRVLREEPLCRACRAAGKTTLASEVDHVVPRQHGGTDERSNLQGLCHNCHSRKTMTEQNGRRRYGGAADGSTGGERSHRDREGRSRARSRSSREIPQKPRNSAKSELFVA